MFGQAADALIAKKVAFFPTTSDSSERIHMTAYLLRFPAHGAMQTHLALVRHEK